MSKKVLIGIIVLICVVLILLLMPIHKNTKFYLDDKYYNTNEGLIIINENDIEKLIQDKSSFVVFTYLPYCTLKVPCDIIFEQFLTNHKMSFYSIPYDEFSNVELFKEIKYAPSVVLVKKGKVIAYLDANKDEDLNKYQDVEDFDKWITSYINIK